MLFALYWGKGIFEATKKEMVKKFMWFFPAFITTKTSIFLFFFPAISLLLIILLVSWFVKKINSIERTIKEIRDSIKK
jgi:hypothetical protein